MVQRHADKAVGTRSMIPKNGNRFSDEIMLRNRLDEVGEMGRITLVVIFSWPSARLDRHGMDPRVSAVRFAPAPPEDDEGMRADG